MGRPAPRHPPGAPARPRDVLLASPGAPTNRHRHRPDRRLRLRIRVRGALREAGLRRRRRVARAHGLALPHRGGLGLGVGGAEPVGAARAAADGPPRRPRRGRARRALHGQLVHLLRRPRDGVGVARRAHRLHLSGARRRPVAPVRAPAGGPPGLGSARPGARRRGARRREHRRRRGPAALRSPPHGRLAGHLLRLDRAGGPVLGRASRGRRPGGGRGGGPHGCRGR